MIRKRNLAVLIVGLGVLLGLGGIWFVGWPALSSILSNQKQVSALQETLQHLQTRLKLLQGFAADPEGFAQTTALMTRALPASADTATFVIDLEALSRNIGLTLNALSTDTTIKEEPKPKATPKAAQEKSSESGDTAVSKSNQKKPSPIKKASSLSPVFTFEASLTGTFEQITQWLGGVEALLPVSNVEVLGLSSADDNKMSTSIKGVSHYLLPSPNQTVPTDLELSSDLLGRLRSGLIPGIPIDLNLERDFGKTNPFQ